MKENELRDRKMEKYERREAKALSRYMRDLFDARAESAWFTAKAKLAAYKVEKGTA
jgi:hypothetical protein